MDPAPSDVELEEVDSEPLLSPCIRNRIAVISNQLLQTTASKSSSRRRGLLHIVLCAFCAFLFVFPWILSLFLWLQLEAPHQVSRESVSRPTPWTSAVLSYVSSSSYVVPSVILPTESAPAVPFDPQSLSVSALHSVNRDAEIGCGIDRVLSMVDCRFTNATGYDWFSGRVRGGAHSCVGYARRKCEGHRTCYITLRDAWTTFRCLNASEPLPPPQNVSTLAVSTPLALAPLAGRTLVIYVFFNNSLNSFPNLRYFIENAMRPTQTVDYVVIINSDDPVHNRSMSNFPPLPSNARYLHHLNECLDWGTLGWLLTMQRSITSRNDSHYIDMARYSWFVLINSSVRGPFLARWQDQSSPLPQLWWLYPFQEMLLHDPQVRLSGSTINLLHHPHVQSYVWVTDRIGWELMQSERRITGCHTYWGAVFKGEVGSSRLMIDHGYNLASLSRVYRDADFRAYAAQKIRFPHGFKYNDPYSGFPVVSWRSRHSGPRGAKIELDLYEQMFVKQKQGPLTKAIAALQNYEEAEALGCTFHSERCTPPEAITDHDRWTADTSTMGPSSSTLLSAS